MRARRLVLNTSTSPCPPFPCPAAASLDRTPQIGQVTAWSCALGLAATWDEALVGEWAGAVAAEFRAKGANVILGPGVNVHRVARGGRNAECVVVAAASAPRCPAPSSSLSSPALASHRRMAVRRSRVPSRDDDEMTPRGGGTPPVGSGHAYLSKGDYDRFLANARYISGEDPYLGARLVRPWVKRVQAGGVLAVVKHFVLNNQETNRDTVDARVDNRTLREARLEIEIDDCVDHVRSACLGRDRYGDRDGHDGGVAHVRSACVSTLRNRPISTGAAAARGLPAAVRRGGRRGRRERHVLVQQGGW